MVRISRTRVLREESPARAKSRHGAEPHRIPVRACLPSAPAVIPPSRLQTSHQPCSEKSRLHHSAPMAEPTPPPASRRILRCLGMIDTRHHPAPPQHPPNGRPSPTNAPVQPRRAPPGADAARHISGRAREPRERAIEACVTMVIFGPLERGTGSHPMHGLQESVGDPALVGAG